MALHLHISGTDDSQSSIKGQPALIPIGKLLQLSPSQRKQVAISSCSVFGDIVWDLSEHDSTSSRHEFLVNFNFLEGANIIEHPLLDSVQCFAFSLLADPPRPGIRIPLIAKNFRRGGIVNLLRFMMKRRILSFSNLSRSEFEIFLDQERSRPLKDDAPITDRTLRSRVRGIEWLFQQSDKLDDALHFDPWQTHGTYGKWALSSAMTVIDRGSLRTEVVPDAVVEQLVSTSIRIIRETPRLLQALHSFNNHIPIYESVLSRRNQSSNKIRYTKVEKNPFPFQSFGFRNHKDLHAFYCHIRSATAILIGFLTGMRAQEILSIPSDPNDACVQEIIEINGTQLKCTFVVSCLSKNVPTPQKRTWQTVPIVHEAIRSLAELNSAIGKEKTPWLFRSYKTRVRQGHVHDQRRLSAARLTTSFRNFSCAYGIATLPWKGNLSTRNLRRTFARLMTRNGLGLLELQDQLKHFDPDITRMYGQPSLTVYLHEEKVALSEELYQELLAGVVPIIGGGAPRMSSMREEFQGLTRPDQKKFIQSLSKQTLVDQVDAGLCTYRPEKALCGGNKFNCKPDACQNSVIPLESAIRSLKNRKSENERLLRLIPVASSLQRQHLRAQLEIIDNLLSQAGEITDEH